MNKRKLRVQNNYNVDLTHKRARRTPRIPGIISQIIHNRSDSREMRLAKNVLTLRKVSRLTQREAALLAGVHRDTLSSVENMEHSPTEMTVDCIASAWGLTHDEILYRSIKESDLE